MPSNQADTGRPRLSGFVLARTKSGECSAEVTLVLDGARYVGRATGPSSPLGELRVSAEACIRALGVCSVNGPTFELVGVKHVRAFDANLAIVSVSERRQGGTAQLVGCYLAGDNVCRGAAVAVLHATNRTFGGPASRAEEPT